MEKWECGESSKCLATFMQRSFQENRCLYFKYAWDRSGVGVNMLEFFLLGEIVQKDWVLLSSSWIKSMNTFEMQLGFPCSRRLLLELACRLKLTLFLCFFFPIFLASLTLYTQFYNFFSKLKLFPCLIIMIQLSEEFLKSLLELRKWRT